MVNINLELTKTEYRALKAVIICSDEVCRKGCVFGEMQNKEIASCNVCPFHIAMRKLENLLK